MHQHTADSPYHPGELAVQRRAGVLAEAAWNGQMVRPTFTAGAAAFLGEQHLCFISAEGAEGLLWCSPLARSNQLLEVAAPDTLEVHAMPEVGDPLAGHLRPGQPVGLTAIDFARRRRVRVNGTVLVHGPASWSMRTREVYGNCPKYIRGRPLDAAAATAPITESGAELGAQAQGVLRRADTAILGTRHPDTGNDASHRGGPPGFLRVVDARTIEWDDYVGNAMFNSLGNIAIDSAAGLLVLDDTGQAQLHLSGRADILWTGQDPGDGVRTNRLVRLHVQAVLLRQAVPRDREDPEGQREDERDSRGQP